MKNSSSPITARLKRRIPVLVCHKCQRRMENGKDVRKALKQALKQHGRELNIKPRLMTTGCFGVCPKRAIVVASGAMLDCNQALVIGNAEMADEAAAMLLTKSGFAS